MSISKISPDDPKLTAYALGELEGEERAAVEAALRDDPAAQAAVEQIRAMASQLEFALAAEPMSAAAPVTPADPYVRKGKLLRFPQIYYLVGGLAAACFAVMVALRDPTQHRVYSEVKLVAQEQGVEVALPVAAKADKVQQLQSQAMAPAPVAVNEPQSATGASTATTNGASTESRDNRRDQVRLGQLARDEKKETAKQDPVILSGGKLAAEGISDANTLRVSAGVSSIAGPSERAKAPVSADAENEVVALERFEVASSKDVGYLRAKPAARAPRQIGEVNIQGISLNGAMHATATMAMNTEAYAYQRDNDFLGAVENPLSTFSIDVDTASYANVRRFLQGGRKPPPDAVRVEELVNYFPYHYAPPTGEVPFAASMEVAAAPWAPTHRLVRIGLKGREVSTAARPAANLVFLLDVSGSMDEPNKLPLVKESMRLLIGKLRPDDRVAIAVYAGASGLALPSTPVARAREILDALDALTPGGSTNGAMGIQLAYDIAKANFITGGVNRVILCTDGDFNVGVTSEGELTRLIEEKAKSGVFLTALGFGMGNYKDATLEKLADKGNGNYGYIDTRREAEKLLVEQVNGTLLTIAKDVKLQVEFNPALVASYRLIGYENRLLKKEDFNNDKIDAGEIGAGHTVTALYEIVPASQTMSEGPGAKGEVDELKYRTAPAAPAIWKENAGVNPASKELLTLKIRYKEPAGEVSRKLEFPLTDAGTRFADASADFKFAAAVAEFGMILRDSPHKGTGTLAGVLAWAQAGADDDAGGYRSEFTGLVRQAEMLLR